MDRHYSDITPEIRDLAQICVQKDRIPPDLYVKYDVKRGLRDLSGKGVLAGLTDISEVRQVIIQDGKETHIPGKLFYRGVNVEDLIEGCQVDRHYGFEEATYLLLFGDLPTKKQLKDFKALLGEYRTLPTNFVRDVIMKAPARDIMNALSRSVLTLSSYDANPTDISIENVLRQCLQLISVLPVLSVYGYHAYNHYVNNESMFIHTPDPELSTAENILRLLRPDKQYTPLEAKVLDRALILHAEHGGGNNSTFTMRVVTSSGTDTYSATAAALSSLKGPRHGGANIKVTEMMENIKANIKDWNDEDEITAYLYKLLNKEAFDRSGLIYGIGHAVYSISDPRAGVLKGFVESLSQEKHREEEFALYQRIERLAPIAVANKCKMYRSISSNVDFYSGFAYQMLDLPVELYTPIFAIARMAGWSAHRMEELLNNGKIIRPAYRTICTERDYVPLCDR